MGKLSAADKELVEAAKQRIRAKPIKKVTAKYHVSVMVRENGDVVGIVRHRHFTKDQTVVIGSKAWEAGRLFEHQEQITELALKLAAAAHNKVYDARRKYATRYGLEKPDIWS